MRNKMVEINQYQIKIKKGRKELAKYKIEAESSDDAADRAKSAYRFFRHDIDWNKIEIVVERIK